MVSTYDLLKILGPITGFAIGGPAGAGAGLWIGNLPLALAKLRLRRRLERSSIGDLRQIIRRGEFQIYHPVLTRLMARGENIEMERPFVLDLLSSDSTVARVFGWHALRSAFPQIAARIPDFHPYDSTEACRAKAKNIDST